MIRFTLCAGLWTFAVFNTASAQQSDPFQGADPREIAEVTAHQDLVMDAETHLQPCPVPDEDEMCKKNQHDFILDWIYAFYNDPDAARNLAFWLSNEGGPPIDIDPTSTSELGIIPSPLWGCAWRIAVITAGGTEFMNTDLAEYKIGCQSGLSEDDQNSANDIAYSVLVKIHDNLKAGPAPVDYVNSN